MTSASSSGERAEGNAELEQATDRTGIRRFYWGGRLPGGSRYVMNPWVGS